MCTLEKMLISGIRSFSPHNETKLHFSTPMTLIVGHNGAGKTTIIECLKQVTTGSMPPNCKNGQTFVHDPEIAKEVEVKAQIKLQMRNAQDQPIVVHRCFMLTQQKTKKTFKSLDGTIGVLDPATGKMKALGRKCADMDKTVPFTMGVSQAVLEHVVFVHQEDSLWPLAESRPVKEKFDAIFAATKYTAAVGKMRELIKEKNTAIKECKINLEHLKMHHAQAQRLRHTLRADEAEQKSLLFKQQGLAADVTKLKAELAVVEGRLEEFKEQREAAEKLRATLAVRQDDVACHRERMPQDAWDVLEHSGTSEKLTSHRELILERLGRKRQKRDEKAQAKGQAEADVARARQSVTEASNAAARRQAELAQYERTLNEMSNQILDIAGACGVAAPAASPITAEAARRFCADVEAREKRLQDELASLKQSNRDAQAAVTQASSDVNARLSSFDKDIKTKTEQLSRLQGNLQRAQARIATLPLPIKLANLQEEIATARAALAERDLDSKLAETDAELTATATERAALAAQVATQRKAWDKLVTDSQSATRLRVAQEALAQLRAQETALIAQHAAALDQALQASGQAAPPAPLQAAAVKGACQALTSSLRQALSAAQARQSASAGQLAAKQSECKSLEERLQQGTAEADGLAHSVASALAAPQEWVLEDDVDAAVAGKLRDASTPLATKQELLHGALVASRQAAVEAREQSRAQAQYGRVWVAHARKENRCKICERPFAREEERAAFCTRHENTQRNALEANKEDEREVEQALKLEKDVQRVAVSVQRHSALQAELPKLRSGLQEAQAACSALEAEVAAAAAAAGEAQARLQVAQDLNANLAVPLGQLQQQLSAAADDVENLRVRAGASSQAGDTKQVEAALKAADQGLAAVEARRDALLATKSSLTDERNTCREQLAALQADQVRLQSAVQERNALEESAKHMAASERAAREELDGMRGGHEPLKAEAGSLKARLQALRAQHDAEEREAYETVTALQQRHELLKRTRAAVVTFEAEGVRQAAAAAAAGIEERSAAAAAAEAALAAVTEKAAHFEEVVTQLEGMLRSIDTAAAYLVAEAAVSALNAQLADVEAEAAGADLDADSRERARVAEELRRVENASSALSGRLEGLSTRLADTRQNLAQPVYQTVDHEHRKHHVELETLLVGNKDLERYCKALEKALLQYHSTKMESINQSLKELWQKTYRGNDIEYIQIKAETTDTGRSTYNYRVVMVQNGAELDMRGRCSAGQKVLACILIRMALAESFCIACGVIALDEPTTNLDAANSAALAQALRSIIDLRQSASRESKRAFQLVVITHDEAFATQLGTREYCEELTRVWKDEDFHSRLKVENVQ